MPTYVYECPNCKSTLELARQVKDRDYPVRCSCVHDKMTQPLMKRIIAPTNFILKGNGWAKDGYSK